jgi:hypothetical protein
MKQAAFPALLLLGVATTSSSASFYKNENALFSQRPAAHLEVTNLTRFGPVGLSLDLVQPAFTMRISGVEPGSPAAATSSRRA